MSESGWHDFYTLEGYIAYQTAPSPFQPRCFLRYPAPDRGSQQNHFFEGPDGWFNQCIRKTGVTNVQGEEQMKLDLLANDIMKTSLQWLPSIVGLASEEDGEMTIVTHPNKFDGDHYIVFFDPIDGSSNIDVNVSVGTVFSIHRCPCHTQAD